EKKAFFDLAQQMIVADGYIADAEMAHLDRLYEEAGYGPVAPIIDVNEHVDLTVFASPSARLAVSAELPIISIVDGECQTDEADFANNLIDDLGITGDQHAEICRIAENAADALVSMRNLAG
ncbi:MAG: hypothetical protein VW338_18580, partial [Rhodospirillaceae bacterium]